MESYRPPSHIRRIGLMGGTFDPIHYGHLVVAEEVRATLHLAEVVFIPAGQPPHKQGEIVTAVEHRLAMLELAIASNPHFSISRVDVERAGPSYTVETLRLLRQQWGEQTALYFIIGWDSLEELSTWRDPTGILTQLTALVAIHRPGHQEVSGYRKHLEEQLPAIRQRLFTMPAPQLAISATDLRLRVAEGKPIKYQTPEAVENYIIQYGLYRQKIGSRKTTYGTHAS
ncbi:MAG: nicotinate-nucleotide adenylyltransferase [Ktedonobacteraceae bacterium]